MQNSGLAHTPLKDIHPLLMHAFSIPHYDDIPPPSITSSTIPLPVILISSTSPSTHFPHPSNKPIHPASRSHKPAKVVLQLQNNNSSHTSLPTHLSLHLHLHLQSNTTPSSKHKPNITTNTPSINQSTLVPTNKQTNSDSIHSMNMNMNKKAERKNRPI